MKKILLTASLVLMIAQLQACSPMGVVAGSTASLGVASSKEGGLGQAIDDTEIRIQINDMWFRHNVDMFTKLNLNIREGRVLLTGVVQDPQMRVDAVRLSWQADGVRQVINEIRVDQSSGLLDYAKDTLIITKLRAKITFDKEISSLNYTVDAVNGVVYVMGVAQNQQELEKVIDHSRNISHVKEVVSYVRIKEGQGAQEPVKGDYKDVNAQKYDDIYRVNTVSDAVEER